LPIRLLHELAGVLFLVFGLWLLFDGALGWRQVAIAVTASIGGGAVLAAVIAAVSRRRRQHAAAG
jgi:Ca2+/H+ antiporter, TMEM165/GDT1 family